MHQLALIFTAVFAAGNASAIGYAEALARHEKWKDNPFQLVVDPRKYTNVPDDYSYPEYHYMRQLSVVGPDGAERPAPLAMIDALINAEISVMGEASRRCVAAGQRIYDDRLNDTAISRGITFVSGTTAYERKTGAQNTGIAAENITLAIPRLLGNLYGGAAYIVDKQVNGYETLKDADEIFKAEPLKESYKVELGEGSPGWRHVEKAGKEYVAKAYVRDDPAAMRNFVRQFFRKGAGCDAYKVGADEETAN